MHAGDGGVGKAALTLTAGQAASAGGSAAAAALASSRSRTAPLTLLAVMASSTFEAVAAHHAQEIAWGDFPTWLAVVAAAAAAVAAFWQLRLQRLQLHDQQKVIAEQALLLERQQANRIDLTIQDVPQDDVREPPLIRADISNRSDRPIRNIRCRIKLAPGRDAELMTWVNELTHQVNLDGIRVVGIGRPARGRPRRLDSGRQQAWV